MRDMCLKIEGKKRGSGSQEMDGLKKGLLPYTWCGGSSGQVYKVNHGGVSKRRDWANLHRALRGRGEGLGGPCCQPK